MPESTNTPEFTVSELAGALRRTIESSFGLVRLRGEISNYRGPHSSGHAYFRLKDQNARIDAVIWKSTFSRLKTKPEEGLEVIATGKVTTFPNKSAYQIVVEALEPAGIGALMALLEERRRKLAAEGFFEEARKRAIPFLPATIGVVTSPTGAVIRDILHRIAERFPRYVLVWPARVQGETCATEVAAAIEGFNALPSAGIPRPDVIIVARGGGSLEDLWGFNDEIVVRAAAGSRIPLISAIGHETDWTLIDHAADLRAPTATGAAEKAVPVKIELATALADLGRRHLGAAQRLLAQRRGEWRALSRALPRAEEIGAGARQRCDRAASQLLNLVAATLDRRRIGAARLAHRLANQSPQAKMARAAQRLEALEHRLRHCRMVAAGRRRQELSHAGRRLQSALTARMRLERERIAACRPQLEGLGKRMMNLVHAGIERRRTALDAGAKLLDSLGYRQVLSRGFALVRDAQGRPLRRATDVASGARLDIEFADGHRSAVAGDRPREARSEAQKKSAQGKLF